MPKRLVGGVFLLCLTALTLTLSEDSETLTNITQPEILEQLTNLKKYISNPSMIKPVWVQLKNGDEIVVVQGELKVVDTGEFEISVAINGYKLLIHIKFTQMLNEDDEPLDDWYIDTNDAKYLFTSDAQDVKATIEDADFGDVELAGDLSVGGDLSVTGDASVKTISQSQPNYISDNFSFNPITGIEFEDLYNRFEVINGILYLVVNVKVTNTTENAISIATIDRQIELPPEIAEKIIDMEGKTVKENATTDYCLITGDTCLSAVNSPVYSAVKYDSWNIFVANRVSANKLQVFIYRATPYSLTAGSYIYLTGRIALTLI